MDPIASYLGTWTEEIGFGSILLRICLSVTLSAVIGCER